ncbi:MAG: cupin domain-containing protein [Pseudomonadota bacterium]
MELTPQAIIDHVGMQKHPEGGWYAETYRDERQDGACASTAIYFLLEAGERSHWHKVHGSSEVWHHYAGDALALEMSEDGKAVTEHHLGTDFLAGEQPQLVVPAGWWQAARPLGAWTLVGCTVAPGFSFENFELAEPGWAPGER